MSRIKLLKALRKCNFRPRQEDAVVSALPLILIERLTSSELAEVMKTLDAHWRNAQETKEREIVADGYIWSAQHGKLLDLCVKDEDGTVDMLYK